MGLQLDLVSTVQHPWLWLGVVPGGQQQLWAAFSLISSELEGAGRLCSASQAAGEKREWRMAGYANCSTTKGEGEEFPIG